MSNQEMLEQVIKGLGLCMIPETGGCDDCTYFGKGICQMLLAEDAILLLEEQKKAIDFQSDRLDELLKAQEPVEPKQYEGTSYCGNCGDPINKLDNYCHECGRAVKWE